LRFGGGREDTRRVSTARRYSDEHATDDVLATMRWLEASGYVLTEATGGTGEGNGSVRLVFTGRREVAITLDRSQWVLDVADAPGSRLVDFDLLLPSMRGIDYADWAAAAAQAAGGARLPDQLPRGVSWRQTLPLVLEWLGGPGVAGAIALASDQRYAVTWPTSHKARALRRRWRQQVSTPKDRPGPSP
jgi:hypothetical protein